MLFSDPITMATASGIQALLSEYDRQNQRDYEQAGVSICNLSKPWQRVLLPGCGGQAAKTLAASDRLFCECKQS